MHGANMKQGLRDISQHLLVRFVRKKYIDHNLNAPNLVSTVVSSIRCGNQAERNLEKEKNANL
jgi:hypothetical protein